MDLAAAVCSSCQAANDADAEVCFQCGRHMTALTQGSLIASRYEILELLGKGGMGMVYKAHDQLLDETVAIKVLRSEFAGNPEIAQRFRSELKLARKVSHANVCRIHEYGEANGVNYISMALIEGIDLKQRLRHHPGGLPVDIAFGVALQVAEGLRAIHDVGVIHRDLKSSNVVVDETGTARLMDFGIAKESAKTGGLTATGEVMGTPEYMSPEQCRGEVIDFRSDVYSLGIMIYELFTGHVPFHGDTLMATLLKQVQEPPPLEGPAAAAIPRGVVALLRKALAKDPARRQASAGEVAEELRRAQLGAESPLPAEPAADQTTTLPSASDRRRHTRLPISVDMLLRRIGAGGSTLQEERTVTDDIGLHGARVLTTMLGLNKGDTVAVKEVGGTFETRSAIRHVYKSQDQIHRLGLEFLDRTAPEHLVPSDSSKPRTGRSQAAAAVGKAAAAPVVAGPTVRSAEGERRQDSRLDITVEVQLRRLGPGGSVLGEERTIADNIGRRGARVLSAMPDIGVGQMVQFQEVGTDFQTRATVRSVFVGPDGIKRMGLEFLDRTTPERLLPAGDSKPRLPRTAPQLAAERPAPAPAPAAPPPLSAESAARRREVLATYEGLKSRNHFEVLGIPRASGPDKVKEAYFRLARLYHPDVPLEAGLADLKKEIGVIYQAVSTAYEVLIDRENRSRYESILGRSKPAPPPPAAPAPPAVAEKPQPEPRPAPEAPPAVRPEEFDDDSDVRIAEQVVRDARKLLADGSSWDAIQMLEAALDVGRGKRINQMIRVTLAQATAKNPKWRKKAEEMLLALTRESPPCIEAFIALGSLYEEAGLRARAASQLRRALELEPGHVRALTQLQELERAGGQAARTA